MNVFNGNEFSKICKQLQVSEKEQEITLEYKKSNFVDRIKKMVAKDRRGEVVFGVIRPNGKLIIVTCEEYPIEVFRVPTGGINYGEDILEAVQRETMEELGLVTEIIDFGGVVKIKFVHGEDSEMFYSYLFLLKEKGGILLEDATEAEVSEVREVDADELYAVADMLNNIEGKWSDWGKFRSITTKAIADMYLQQK